VSELKEAIRNWSDHTPRLLDYVYFHTEPMINAQPGALLDFSTATKRDLRPLQMQRLDRNQIKRAREALKVLAEKSRRELHLLAEREASQLHDAHFEAGLRALDGEDLQGGLDGTASLPAPE
jgi:hypothetical protein